MKKQTTEEELQTHKAEYAEDYGLRIKPAQVRRNPYYESHKNARSFVIDADGSRREVRIVELDEDISNLFSTSESVNNALRMLISALPDTLHREVSAITNIPTKRSRKQNIRSK